MEEQFSTVQKLVNTAIEFLVKYSFEVVGAVLVLIIASIVGNWTAGLLLKIFEKKKMDVTLAGFVAGTVKVIILVFAGIIAIGKFGITIAPFIAALGAMAFGATYAIQGPLSNYGAGISIILSRPFKIGDTITVIGVSGVVTDIKMAATSLITEEGVRITIPNKHIVGEVIHNSAEYRIAEGVIGISYNDDPQTAIDTIKNALGGFTDITANPKPQIGIKEFGDSSVNITYRYWVPTAKYFQVLFAVNLAVYKAVQTAKLTIPYPQRDIHMVTQSASHV